MSECVTGAPTSLRAYARMHGRVRTRRVRGCMFVRVYTYGCARGRLGRLLFYVLQL